MTDRAEEPSGTSLGLAPRAPAPGQTTVPVTFPVSSAPPRGPGVLTARKALSVVLCLFGSSCVQGVCEAAGVDETLGVDALFSVLQALTAGLGYEQGVEEEGVPPRWLHGGDWRLSFAWCTPVGLALQAGAGGDLVPVLCLTTPSLPP